MEIPGLIVGAAEDRGGGRALLGVLRGADAMVYCHDVTAPATALREVQAEVAAAGITLPTLLAATKMDDAGPDDLARLQAAFPALAIVPISVLDEESLALFKDALWTLTGLMRVYLRHGGTVDDEPLALPPGVSVDEVADGIHHDLGARCVGARV